MASATKQGAQLLNGWKKLGRFETGLGAELPQSYKKFWKEWKIQQVKFTLYIKRSISEILVLTTMKYFSQQPFIISLKKDPLSEMS